MEQATNLLPISTPFVGTIPYSSRHKQSLLGTRTRGSMYIRLPHTIASGIYLVRTHLSEMSVGINFSWYSDRGKYPHNRDSPLLILRPREVPL